MRAFPLISIPQIPSYRPQLNSRLWGRQGKEGGAGTASGPDMIGPSVTSVEIQQTHIIKIRVLLQLKTHGLYLNKPFRLDMEFQHYAVHL